MRIERISAVTPDLVADIARLLPALDPVASPPDGAALAEILAGGTLFVARQPGGAICGAVTLVLYRIPTGKRARIESLVVDQAARGQGVGEALCRAAIALAEERGADTVDLTSAPRRAAAHRLYERLGFSRRETNSYRLDLRAG